MSSEHEIGMEKFLKFSNFSKILEKRAWGTHNTPKPADENFEKVNFFTFSKFSFAGLGVLWVPQALFFKIFEKFENFRNFSIPISFSLDKNSSR